MLSFVSSGTLNTCSQMQTGTAATKKSQDYCQCCNVRYGYSEDAKKYEDWIQCCICSMYQHESCALDNGIQDDDDSFRCRDCLAWLAFRCTMSRLDPAPVWTSLFWLVCLLQTSLHCQSAPALCLHWLYEPGLGYFVLLGLLVVIYRLMFY